MGTAAYFYCVTKTNEIIPRVGDENKNGDLRCKTPVQASVSPTPYSSGAGVKLLKSSLRDIFFFLYPFAFGIKIKNWHCFSGFSVRPSEIQILSM